MQFVCKIIFELFVPLHSLLSLSISVSYMPCIFKYHPCRHFCVLLIILVCKSRFLHTASGILWVANLFPCTLSHLSNISPLNDQFHKMINPFFIIYTMLQYCLALAYFPLSVVYSDITPSHMNS